MLKLSVNCEGREKLPLRAKFKSCVKFDMTAKVSRPHWAVEANLDPWNDWRSEAILTQF